MGRDVGERCLNMTAMDMQYGGLYRKFSKGGDGFADNNNLEITFNGYACFPSGDGGGVEYIISSRISAEGTFGDAAQTIRSAMAAYPSPQRHV